MTLKTTTQVDIHRWQSHITYSRKQICSCDKAFNNYKVLNMVGVLNSEILKWRGRIAVSEQIVLFIAHCVVFIVRHWVCLRGARVSAWGFACVCENVGWGGEVGVTCSPPHALSIHKCFYWPVCACMYVGSWLLLTDGSDSRSWIFIVCWLCLGSPVGWWGLRPPLCGPCDIGGGGAMFAPGERDLLSVMFTITL